MALIAIILSKFLSHNWLHIFFIVSISITVLWYWAEDALVIKLLLMLLFGFTFGALEFFQNSYCYSILGLNCKTHLLPGKYSVINFKRL